ncbi:MAG: proline dehydrogenase family protein [Methanomassiliicoccales archaeon]|nr:proline dehydrogenase family protein [Methanomassiliicoccales archaeon]
MPDRWTLPDRDAALAWCARRNEQGIRCILDILGRYNQDEEKARQSYEAYVELSKEMAIRRLKASISVKPSTLGGTAGRQYTKMFVRSLCEKASDMKIGLEFDMEGQRMVDLTLELAEDCASTGMKPTIALQAYLNRTPQDIERMLDAGARVRLVKGAYSGDIRDYTTICEVYKDLVEMIISRDVPFCVATHDPDILEWVQQRMSDREMMEFSFLKGLADETKGHLVSNGWRVSEYVPYGSNKEGYEARRKAYLRTLDELGRVPAP